MKILLILVFIFVPITVFSQTEFFEFNITFDKQNPLLDKQKSDLSGYYTETALYFDWVEQNDTSYVFMNFEPTGLEYTRTYDELVRLYGQEEVSRDYIPDSQSIGVTAEELIELCRSGKGEVMRFWYPPGYLVALSLNKVNLMVVFCKRT